MSQHLNSTRRQALRKSINGLVNKVNVPWRRKSHESKRASSVDGLAGRALVASFAPFVAMPGDPRSVLATSSDARSP